MNGQTPSADEPDLPIVIEGKAPARPARTGLWLLLVLAVALVAGGFFYWRSETASRKAAEAPVVASTKVYALGTVLPLNKVVTLSPPFGAGDARLLSLDIKEGDQVSKGQLIARLDNIPQYEAALHSAEAALEARKAALAQARLLAVTGLADANASLQRAETQAGNARRDFDRSQSLGSQGVITSETLDQRATALTTAEAEVARVKALQARYLAATPDEQVDVALAIAQLDQAKADVERARADLAKTEVRAPAAGTILKIIARPGEHPSTEGILRMADLSAMTVEAEIYETEAGRIAIGQKAVMTSPSLAQPLTGTIERIGWEIGRQTLTDAGPAANTDARVLDVTIRLDEASAQLAARYTRLQVTTEIETGSAP